MCGIVAIVSHDEFKYEKVLIRSLKELEHRGYDSYGFAAYNRNGHHYWEKSLCPLDKYEYMDEQSRSIIGHTRWATHGKPTIDNAHPIETKDFFIVHNGTLEDWGEDGLTDTQEWSQALQIEWPGHDVDFHLKAWSYGLIGDNLILVMYKKTGDIYALRSGNRQLFKSVILDTDQKIYTLFTSEPTLESEEVFENDQSFVKLSWSDQKPTKHEVKDEVNEYPHLMLKEIHEQKYIKDINVLDPYIHKNLLIYGCGSSYNAGLYGEICFSELSNRLAFCKHASELTKKTKQKIDGITLAISQSGETLDTIQHGHPLLSITNNENCSLAESGYNTYLNVGKERAVAATKTFTATCLALLKLSLKQSPDNWNYKKYDSFLKEFNDNIDHALNMEIPHLEFDRALFLGSGYCYPIAKEAALKMKEVACIPSEGMPSQEVKHGPIALVDEDCLCVVLAHEVTHKINNNIKELESRSGNVLLVQFPQLNVSEPVFALLANVYCQLLAYHTSVRLGLNPDRPKNLAKTVTV